MTINPSLQANPTFDPQRDLAPVARLLVAPSILAVNNDVPAKTVAELIALAKAQPGKLSYASPGTGTPQHIAGEVLKNLARHRHRACALSRRELHRRDRRARHHDVPERRRDPADRARGQAARARHDGAQRSQNMPELPTMIEAGVPDFEVTSWFGLLAPAGTPAAVIAKLHQEAVRIVSQPDLREKFGLIGLDVVSDPPDAFAAIIQTDTAKWAKVIKDAGIKPGE